MINDKEQLDHKETISAYSDFFEPHKRVVRSLKKYKKSSLISYIGGLLTMPEFQSSNFRLALLQNFAVVTACGDKIPRPCSMQCWLNKLGKGKFTAKEDSAENVFVSRVFDGDENYLIFESLCESSAFHLQRFINILENNEDNIPSNMVKPFSDLKRAVRALLIMSDEIVRRSKLSAFDLGAESPPDTISMDLVCRGEQANGRIVFQREDFAHLDIELEDIKRFILDEKHYEKLQYENYGDHSLERQPILVVDGKFYLTIPSFVSMAIRIGIVEFFLDHGQERLLNYFYMKEMFDTFQDVPVFRGRLSSMQLPKEVEKMPIVNSGGLIDEGRALNVCFVFEPFSYHHNQLATKETELLLSQIPGAISNTIDKMKKDFFSQSCFQSGVSLIIWCSWRGLLFQNIEYLKVKKYQWRTEHISAPDFMTINRGFSWLDIWRLLDLEDQYAKKLNIRLDKLNGLLTTYERSESLGGYFFEHNKNELTANSIISWPSDFLLRIRKERTQNTNIHRRKTWEQRTVRVNRFHQTSSFREDRKLPLYRSIDDFKQNRFVAVYESRLHDWWVEIEAPHSTNNFRHQLFEALAKWIGRSAPVIEKNIKRSSRNSILWSYRLEDNVQSGLIEPITVSENENEYYRSLIQCEVNNNVVNVITRKGFLYVFGMPENLGERLLVEAFVTGTLKVLGEIDSPETVHALVEKIVPDDNARMIHMFRTKEFGDYFTLRKSEDALLISQKDDALSRIELECESRNSDEERYLVEGETSCCTHLNNIVSSIWNEIQSKLKTFNREKLLLNLLLQYEDIKMHAAQWNRTARANLSIHDDKQTIETELIQKTTNFSRTLIAIQILIEIAVCQCPKNSKTYAGELDISRLLSNVMHMINYGNWSDVIHYKSMKPEIKITTLGDAHDVSSEETTLFQYGKYLLRAQNQYNVDSYEENFFQIKQDQDETKTEKLFENSFCEAWREEFNFTIDEVFTFMRGLYEEGIDRQKLVFLGTEDEICKFNGLNHLDKTIIKQMLRSFSIWPRKTFMKIPCKYSGSKKESYPWRHRRQLSLVRRPIVKLDDVDSRYLLAPRLILDGIQKTLEYYYRGEYDAKTFSSKKMRVWAGESVNDRGDLFNEKVFNLLQELGWQVKSNIKPTEILNNEDNKLDRDYGDIDVLAWKSGRILAIECKSLELVTSPSDIARQLHDFLGVARDSGKLDRLKKHLQRLELLNNNREIVRDFIGESEFSSIEGLLVFSQKTPMHFSNQVRKCGIRILSIDELKDSL